MEQVEKTELEKRLEAELKTQEERESVPETPEDEAQADVAAEANADAADETEDEPAKEILDPQQVVAERAELKDQLLRARAEFDNYRKRMAREADRVRKTAAEGLVRDLLPVIDHLELAVQHGDDNSVGLAEGVEMVVKQFLDVLNRWGVEPIPAAGEPFDPNVHEAMLQRESEECPANVVLEEFQKGYRMGDLVLRPTKVVVSSGSAPAPASEPAESETQQSSEENPPAEDDGASAEN